MGFSVEEDDVTVDDAGSDVVVDCDDVVSDTYCDVVVDAFEGALDSDVSGVCADDRSGVVVITVDSDINSDDVDWIDNFVGVDTET